MKAVTVNKMNCIFLDKDQITLLYNGRMTQDFPADELRPLSMTLPMIDNGTYEGYALTEEDEIIAYALLIRKSNRYLLDYFAVSESRRNSGIGGYFLGILRRRLSDADFVMAEVEDPDCAVSPEDRALQSRRLGFYLRNGYRNTRLTYRIFGVDFLILESGYHGDSSQNTIAQTYEEIYQSFLNPAFYEKNVVRKESCRLFSE